MSPTDMIEWNNDEKVISIRPSVQLARLSTAQDLAAALYRNARALNEDCILEKDSSLPDAAEEIYDELTRQVEGLLEEERAPWAEAFPGWTAYIPEVQG